SLAKKKPEQTVQAFGRGDAIASKLVRFPLIFIAIKIKVFRSVSPFPIKYFEKIFYGSPNNCVRIFSPTKTKNCVRHKPYTVFGRGDAIRKERSDGIEIVRLKGAISSLATQLRV
ncbi:MAG: hypothetical protein ACI4MC_01175, partial [Candidatus Coproplasma sp.]